MTEIYSKKINDCMEKSIKKDTKGISYNVRVNLGFYKTYKLGRLNRELYPLERKRVEECESALNEIIPIDKFIIAYNHIDKSIEQERIIHILSSVFKVPTSVIEVKLNEIGALNVDTRMLKR